MRNRLLNFAIQFLNVMKKQLFSLLAFFIVCVNLYADKGMWIPSKVDSSLLKLKGLEISYSDIFSSDPGSLKDAVVLFGGGCTGEIVSEQGLIFTNHHCGYSYVVKHSDTINDYLNNGFWAKNMSEEKPNPGLKVSVVESYQEVTQMVLKGIDPQMSEAQRDSIAGANISAFHAKIRKQPFYEYLILPFYQGNAFYFITLKTFKDIRLVAAPPRCIGEFGRESDNWMWPRHSGDFSVFRIYADSLNKPSTYSPSNIPFQSKKHFKINLSGINQGDFTMVYGFPGRTMQYETNKGVEVYTQHANPLRMAYRKTYLDILSKYMNASNADMLNYTSKYNRVANYYKKMKGQQMGLDKVGISTIKKTLQKQAVQRDAPSKNHKVKSIIDSLNKLHVDYIPIAKELVYLYESKQMMQVLSFPLSLQNIEEDTNTDKLGLLLAQLEKSNQMLMSPKKNKALEKEAFLSILSLSKEHLNASTDFDAFRFSKHFLEQHKDLSPEALYEAFYQKSIITNTTQLQKWMDKPSKTTYKKVKEALEQDLAFQFIRDHRNHYNAILTLRAPIQKKIQALDRQYMKALMSLFPEQKFYPNANSTLRLAYGEVDGYTNYQGKDVSYFTTTASLLEKHQQNMNNPEYTLIEPVKKVLSAKDFAPYGKDYVNTCFIATNHTTGGNSGSPVLNKNGELIGINFDRSWESTMSDFYFNPDICRNISVDIRYVLFLIDKLGGMDYLINELDIIQ